MESESAREGKEVQVSQVGREATEERLTDKS